MNILIIKTGALGDVVRTSFIAQALKDKYKIKKPKIFWLTSKSATSFFINNPYVDKIFTEENRQDIIKIDFDLVINLEEDIENAKLTSSIKPKRIVGVFLNKNGEIDYTKDSEYWFNTSLISKYGKIKADILKKQNQKSHRQIMSELIGVDGTKYEPF